MAKDKERIQRAHKGFHSVSTKTMVAFASRETTPENVLVDVLRIQYDSNVIATPETGKA